MTGKFTQAFYESGLIHAHQYSDLTRFLAIMCVILAMMWSLHHFLGSEAKESEGFMVRLGSRCVRIAMGLMLFIIFLTT